MVAIAGTGDGTTSGQIPFTPAAKKALEMSLREALNLGHQEIRTEHLLLGLLADGDSPAVRVLAELDLHKDDLRTQLLRRLGQTEVTQRAEPVEPDDVAPGAVNDLLERLVAYVRKAADANYRLGRGTSGELAHAGGQLEALRTLGLITYEESRLWLRRVMEAAGIEPPHESSSGADPRTGTTADPSAPGFTGKLLRRIVTPATWPEGPARVNAVELYEDGLLVRTQLIDAGLVRLDVLLDDDVGTEYREEHSARCQAAAARFHDTVFTPSPPEEAAELVVRLRFDEGAALLVQLALVD